MGFLEKLFKRRSATADDRTETAAIEELTRAAFFGDDAKVKVLLGRGAVDVTQRDQRGMTALMAASAQGHADVVETLLAAGAKVNEQDKTGLTPLMSACIDGHLKVAKVLLARGADVDVVDKNGMTALKYSSLSSGGHTDVVKILHLAKKSGG